MSREQPVSIADLYKFKIPIEPIDGFILWDEG